LARKEKRKKKASLSLCYNLDEKKKKGGGGLGGSTKGGEGKRREGNGKVPYVLHRRGSEESLHLLLAV